MNKDLLQELINIRRTIHQNPELGYQENLTAALVIKELEKLKIPYERIASTGIIASLKKGDGPCIVLRADMDALPIQEQTDLEFQSKSPGLMHACGHDIHATILIGAAHQLINSDFKGTIKFVFQPSEEGNRYDPLALTGELKKSGGHRIAESGLLTDVSCAIGLHVHPLVPVGKIAYCLGEALAATADFNIEIKGVSGHAAFPHFTIDPIYIASKLITEAQSIISRNIDPTASMVLSFTNIKTGKINETSDSSVLSSSSNIIPEVVSIQGTIRALNLEVSGMIKQKLAAIAESYKISDGADIKIEYTLDYPSLKNDKVVHEKLNPVLTDVFGQGNSVEVKPLLGGEDFAFYSQKVPSMFYFLGAKSGNNEYFLHHPKVVFNEDCIEFGIELLSGAALKLLS